MMRRFASITALCVGLLHGSEVLAQTAPDRGEADELRWRDDWPRFHWAEYTTTGVLIGGTVLTGVFAPKNLVFWHDTNGFDDEVREGLRLGQPDAAALASDVIMGTLLIYPYLDAGIAWLGHGSPDVAWQMAMINTQSLAISMAITTGVKFAAGRERPNARECEEIGRGDDPECTGDDYASSFYSGHAAMTFTGAGLACAHHTNLELYGGGAPDYIACATALGAAATTGVLRINADRHYATDVLVGGLVGSLSGYLLPNLLHYQFRPQNTELTPDDDRTGITVMPVPLGGENFAGVGAVGMF